MVGADLYEEDREVLKAFLHAQDVQTLADRLLELADRDGTIEMKLQHWRKVSLDHESVADIEALITELFTPDGNFVNWRECSAYDRRGQAVLPLLAKARACYPYGSVTLSVHAMRRAWNAVNQSEDTSDICDLIKAIGMEFVEALRGAGSQPPSFGDTYLQLLLEAPFGCFDKEAALAAIGEVAVARYRTRRLCSAGVQPRTGPWPQRPSTRQKSKKQGGWGAGNFIVRAGPNEGYGEGKREFLS